jgi:CRISPR system Cascade subunit CasD
VRCLLLRLEGPLMAFGDVAVDEIRPTRRLPTLSMLTGLLANAMGWDHGDVDRLQALQDRLAFAARLDRAGRTVVDYQTAILNKRDPLWTTRGVPAERGGGGSTWDERGYGTLERWRHYLADAAATVALTLDPPGPEPTLDALAAALRRPERPLFLGRKGCPPAGPVLLGEVEDAATLRAALAGAPLARRHDDGPLYLHELADRPGEPAGDRTVEVADRRDWRAGFHAGSRAVREARLPAAEG